MLGDLAEFRNGLNYTQAARRHGGLPIIGVKDFQSRLFVEFEGLEELDPREVEIGDATVRAGDILFVRSNGNRELIGRSMLVSTTPPRTTTHSGFTIRLRCRDDRANPRFLAYLLRGPLIRRTLSSQGGGTNISNLNQGILASLRVSLPPKYEQERITSILGAYDDLIEVNRRRIALLEEMAQRLFEEWFVRFRFPGREDSSVRDKAGERPPTWREGTLGDLVALAYGRALRATERIAGDVPVIGSSGVVGLHNAALVPRPGIVVGRKGHVGSIIWSPKSFYPIDTVFFVESNYPPRFLTQLLRRMPFQSSDAAVPGLNRSAALKLPVLVPPRNLIDRFEVTAAPMLAFVDELREAQARLTTSRDLILPRLVSGELSLAAAEHGLEVAA